jgi:uncharacterized RDD family membrane protein YckC
MEEIVNNDYMSGQPDNNDINLAGLSGRGTRLAAAIIDSILLIIPNTIVFVLFYGFNGYMENLTKRNLEFTLSSLFLGLLVNLVFNGYPLYKNGQTIGKMIMDIKIVDMNNNIPSLFRSFFLRSFLFSVLVFIPFIDFVAMLDIFFIFSQSRRCLHDRVAGTKVVDVEPADN